jgi:hypothetical protein
MRFYSETGAPALTTAQIIPFRRRQAPHRNCCSCGANFIPLHVGHTLCQHCYYWTGMLRGIAIMERARTAFLLLGDR